MIVWWQSDNIEIYGIQTFKLSLSIIEWLTTKRALLFHVQPLPQAFLVAGVLASQDQAVIVPGLLQTDLALYRVICFNFDLLSEVDEQHSRKYLGENFFQQIFPSQQGVSDSDEYEIEASHIKYEFIEEDRFAATIADQSDYVRPRYAQYYHQCEDQHCGLLVEVECEFEGSFEKRR